MRLSQSAIGICTRQFGANSTRLHLELCFTFNQSTNQSWNPEKTKDLNLLFHFKKNKEKIYLPTFQMIFLQVNLKQRNKAYCTSRGQRTEKRKTTTELATWKGNQTTLKAFCLQLNWRTEKHSYTKVRILSFFNSPISKYILWIKQNKLNSCELGGKE